MTLISMHVSYLMSLEYRKTPDGEWVHPLQMKTTLLQKFLFPLNTVDTYMMIFSKLQYASGIETLKTIPGIKILYQSVPADNKMHPGDSANTVVLFEIDQ